MFLIIQSSFPASQGIFPDNQLVCKIVLSSVFFTFAAIAACSSVHSLESAKEPNALIPWIVHVTNQKPISWIENGILYPGFLVSSSLVLLSQYNINVILRANCCSFYNVSFAGGRLFYRQNENKDWTLKVFKSHSVFVAEFNNGLKINVICAYLTELNLINRNNLSWQLIVV